jgi:hypothetical protein
MRYSQQQAKEIIANLDSPNEEIRARGRQKLAILEASGPVDLIEMQRVAKSAWDPGNHESGFRRCHRDLRPDRGDRRADLPHPLAVVKPCSVSMN